MSDKTTAQVLREARALISDPEDWAGSTLDLGRPGRHHSRHCITTAVSKVTTTSTKPVYVAARDLLDQACDTHAWIFNDSHSHAEVLKAFDVAIALAEEQG